MAGGSAWEAVGGGKQGPNRAGALLCQGGCGGGGGLMQDLGPDQQIALLVPLALWGWSIVGAWRAEGGMAAGGAHGPAQTARPTDAAAAAAAIWGFRLLTLLSFGVLLLPFADLG